MCKRARVIFTCFLWWTWPQQPDRAAVLSVPSGNNRAECVASVALLLGFVQWGAVMQMEMGSVVLTQDIISCQRFVAFL